MAALDLTCLALVLTVLIASVGAGVRGEFKRMNTEDA